MPKSLEWGHSPARLRRCFRHPIRVNIHKMGDIHINKSNSNPRRCNACQMGKNLQQNWRISQVILPSKPSLIDSNLYLRLHKWQQPQVVKAIITNWQIDSPNKTASSEHWMVDHDKISLLQNSRMRLLSKYLITISHPLSQLKHTRKHSRCLRHNACSIIALIHRCSSSWRLLPTITAVGAARANITRHQTPLVIPLATLYRLGWVAELPSSSSTKISFRVIQMLVAHFRKQHQLQASYRSTTKVRFSRFGSRKTRVAAVAFTEKRQPAAYDSDTSPPRITVV